MASHILQGMGMVILKLLVLPVMLSSLCDTRATGTVGNIFPGNDSKFQNEDKAACMWAGLCIMVNNTFTAVGAVATRARSGVEEVLRSVEVILESPHSVLNETIKSRAEEAKRSAKKAKNDINRTLEVVKKARGEGCKSLLTANSEFEGSKRKKGEILKFLVNNFTLCRANYALNPVTVVEGEKYIEGNISNLGTWANDTKNMWSNVSSETWGAIESASSRNVPSTWNSIREKLIGFLGEVAAPLISAKLNLSTAEIAANCSTKMLHDNKEKVSGELTQKFERLCTTTNQVRSIVHHLSAVNETVFKGITKARSHASEVTKRMRGIRTYSDAFKRIAPYPASSTPTHKLSIENNAAEQRAKDTSARSEKVESLSRNAMEIIDKINDISAFELSAIQTRLHKLGKELRAINRTSGGQSERGCGSEVGHETLYSLLEVSRVGEEVSNNLNTEDAKKNWTAITSNFTVLQQTVTSIEENVKESEGALRGIEDVRKNVASVVKSELESVRTSLCEASQKLGSATAYHVSMNQRFAKADEGVGEVQKQTAAVQKLVKQVRSDAESYRHAEKTATGAVEESKQACMKAEESAAEGDDEAQWAVKEACEAAKSVALERERVADEMHRMREADRSAANYAADALRVRLNAGTAKKTALEARANIEKLLKRVDAQIKEVEKRFNDTVASLENLDFTHAPTACANTGITTSSDPIEDLAGAVVNFRQFVAETTDKNFSVIASTLKESEKRMRNELEGVRKAAEGAKSMLVRATAIRELSRAQRETTRTALRRAKKALREAQEAADRAASGCLPLHKQVLRILTHLS